MNIKIGEYDINIRPTCDVGAGDSFTAAFISALLKGKPVKEAHELASRLAAYVCTKQGAMPQMDERVLF